MKGIKARIKNIKDFIDWNKKILLTASGCLIGIFLFFGIFDNWLVFIWNKLIVIPIIIRSDLTHKEWVILLLNVFIIIGLLRFFLKKGHPPKWVIRATLTLTLAYFYFTICYSPIRTHIYIFHFSGLTWLRYTDFMFLVLTNSIYWAIKEWVVFKKRKPYNRSIFSLEQSAEEKGFSDDLKRRSKAMFIAEQIFKTETKQAFGIGIVGSWGSGKTYFMDLIKEEVGELNKKSNDKIQIIEFTPWVNSESRSITELFLEKVSNDIEGETSNKIKDYSKRIFNSSSGVLSSLTNIQLSIGDTLSTDEINNSILKSNKKLLIVIDDIDRLSHKEVIEVFRIIRNTANFTNTLYLVAYDREFVDGALSEISKVKKEEYINKIIQFEFYLPQPKPIHLVQIFEEILISAIEKLPPKQDRNKLKDLMKEMISKIIYAEDAIKNHDILHFEDLIENTRDVHKIANSILFNLTSDPAKIDILDCHDLFWIEAIKLRSPRCYERIRTKQMLKIRMSLHNNICFCLSETEIDQEEINKDINVAKAIKLLFDNTERESKENAISNPNYFDWYFESYTTILTPVEKERIREADISELKFLINLLLVEKKRGLVNFANELSYYEGSINSIFLNLILLKNNLIPLRIYLSWEDFFRQEIEKMSDKLSAMILDEINSANDQEILNLLPLIINGTNISLNKSEDEYKTFDPVSLLELRCSTLEKVANIELVPLKFKWGLYLAISELIKESGEYNTIKLKAKQIISNITIKDISLEYIRNIVLIKNIYDKEFFYLQDSVGSATNIFDLEELSLYSIDSNYRWFFREYNSEVWNALRGKDSSYQLEWTFELVNRIIKNDFVPVLFHDSLIAYQSNEFQVELINAKTMQKLICAEFDHSELKRKSYPQKLPALFFAGAKTISQKDLLADDEAQSGGRYEFSYKFEIFKKENFGEIDIYVFVDDECNVTINTHIIREDKQSFFAFSESSKHLIDGINNIVFTVENYSGSKINMPNATGLTNPYALRFLIVLRQK